MAKISIQTQASGYQLFLEDAGQQRELPALWIRAQTFDPEQRDLVTRQRLFNPHQLPTNLSVQSAQWQGDDLLLGFSDGYKGIFKVADLLDRVSLKEDMPSQIPWKADINPIPKFSWPEILSDEKVFFKALEKFIQYGFLIMTDTPTNRDSIVDIANQFGYIRDTNFGPYFEVYSRPDSNDLAYRPVAIGPHTDNPYRTPTPGIQILQCLQNETSGGDSTLVDSLSVAETVRSQDPEGFKLLCTVPVRFEFQDPTTFLVNISPMIEVDGNGKMLGVLYSPRLDDIGLMSDQDTKRFHQARQEMGRLFDDPSYEIRFRLLSGEAMMFDNNRVLHGRTEFNPQEGHRQLQGCYIDRDAPRSHYRVLARKLAAK